MAPSPAVGEPAPDFTLTGTDGEFTLADHRGRRVVLLFYPGDETAVCTRQFCSYRDHADEVGGLDAEIVGISNQDLDSHALFVAKHGLNVPLLADLDGAVAKAYGAWRLGSTKRAVVIVDARGTIAHRHDHVLGLDFQTAEQLGEALAALGPPSPAGATADG